MDSSLQLIFFYLEHLTRTTTVIQTLSFSLGQSDQPTRTHHDYMATVKKVITSFKDFKIKHIWELDSFHRGEVRRQNRGRGGGGLETFNGIELGTFAF